MSDKSKIERSMNDSSPILCTEQGCENWAIVVLVGEEMLPSGRAWCLGHAYLESCPSCDGKAWSCPIVGCGDCQGINQDVNRALQAMWEMENRVFGFIE